MSKRNQIVLLFLLIIILIGINYQFLDSKLEEAFSEYEGGVVERVIDGDTIVVNNISVRLLGINSPENKEAYYDEAKKFLENRTLEKRVRFGFGGERYDRYDRMLAYVFFGGKNVNLELIEQGLANFYFPSRHDRYYSEFVNAWEQCVESNKNLCEGSVDECADCISLEKFDYKNEIIEFFNNCNFDCEMTNWKIKDEGRKNFIFPEFVLGSRKKIKVITGDGTNTDEEMHWGGYDYVWTDSGDALFLRDDLGKLVLWERY